ncbi:hypothetical protein [Haliangium sp. UPWRP_2]|uniref:hypothetical protein n=1 Tax=Haliangium sp. UPWRP_2 TaxID=1931276 RepID=UPI000B5435DF|nr:hypothetical protein [Haliangium sp. UPWRP_2]PSM31903.1 hypothetical protein BVG81_003000 [Haliangium sp. UPWRP_2]
MRSPLSESALAQLFTEARSHHHFRPDPVSDETLHTLYELCKWGPTSVNSKAIMHLTKQPSPRG